MAGIRRRPFLGSVALALPASILVNAPQADSTDSPAHHMKVTRIEALLLERPLTDRFWMSIFPIGGMKPVARRLILKVHTDAGVVGYGEGTGGGAGLFRQGLADLVVGEDPFMVGKVWEKLFALTYSRELVKRAWARTELIEAMAANRRGTLRRHVQICWSAPLQISRRLPSERAGLCDGRLLP